MISGSINSDPEPIICVEVRGPSTARVVEKILDTGFNGSLTLPASVIQALALQLHGREAAELADGSAEVFDVYLAEVVWSNTTRSIQVQEANAQPLLGMDLLLGHDVLLRVAVGGQVTVTPTI
ncbi:MAG TPA: hypothetical protein VHR66_14005 [Gemmataceae bacterium]|jgi:clan AA aspartic protease|nr:hypothetical protein [Gemmataceae bacterium]